MRKFTGMFLRHWRKSPLKTSLTVFSVALGTCILVLVLSAGSIIGDRVASGMGGKGGGIRYVANATWNSDGSQERVMPGEWDADAPSKVVVESGAVSSAALVASLPFDEISVNGSTWRLRSAVGSDPGYFDVFSLKLLAGAPMNAGDLAQGSKRVWISEELATILFGSPADAVGRQLQPPGQLFRRGPGSDDSKILIPYYMVSGVFSTPAEVARRSYGIADLVFPYTSMIPSGMNATFEKRMMAGTFVVRTSGASAKRAEAAIRQVLATDYPRTDGKELGVIVWEGSPRGVSTYLLQLRQAIGTFTVSVNILGLVLLVISSLGIFSVMVVELIGRRREIALERAIGASKRAIITEFWSWSVSLSLIGGLIGVLAALPLSVPVLGTIAPLVGEVSEQFRKAAGITPLSVIEALLLAMVAGGILGALPAFSAVKGSISDTLREV